MSMSRKWGLKRPAGPSTRTNVGKAVRPTFSSPKDTPVSDQTRSLVFPPDPSREGLTFGRLLIDAFGNNYYKERRRILSSFDEGWIYYAFTNPATGRDEPKASYVKSIDWDGTPAAIGAGIYRRDIPGTCESEEVNASGLEADPSKEKLQGLSVAPPWSLSRRDTSPSGP